MAQQYEVKYKTPQGGNNVSTATEMAGSESEAKAKVLNRVAAGSKRLRPAGWWQCSC